MIEQEDHYSWGKNLLKCVDVTSFCFRRYDKVIMYCFNDPEHMGTGCLSTDSRSMRTYSNFTVWHSTGIYYDVRKSMLFFSPSESQGQFTTIVGNPETKGMRGSGQSLCCSSLAIWTDYPVLDWKDSFSTWTNVLVILMFLNEYVASRT